MTQPSQDDVLRALSAIKIPNSDEDIVRGGLLASLSADEEAKGLHVKIVLDVDPAQAQGMEALAALAKESVEALDGVARATVLLSAHKPAPQMAKKVKKEGLPEKRLPDGVKAVIAVASGKGGVGKSTTAVNLAIALARTGLKVGLMDADVYGPSVPRLLGFCGADSFLKKAEEPNGTPACAGVTGKVEKAPSIKTAVMPAEAGIPFSSSKTPLDPRFRGDDAGKKRKPVIETNDDDQMLPLEAHGIKVLSIGFLVKEGAAMIWRGPMVHSALSQMLYQADWGELDLLILDMPPGTGDASLSVAQLVPLTGAVIVSTPQDLALLDVRKGIAMFQKLGVPVLGLIENMSYFECPHCHGRTDIFGHGGAKADAARLGLDFLGQVPLDLKLRESSDAGTPLATAKSGPIAALYAEMAMRLRRKIS